MTTTPAMPELHRDQIIDLISPLSKNSADHDIEFANRVIDALAALQSQPATESPCACWPGRMCSRSAQCSRDAQPAAAGVSDAVDLALQRAETTLRLYPAWIGLADECKRARAILALRPQAVPMTEAARDVLAERQRQITAEGWTPEHDDEHSRGEMARAAATYALNAASQLSEHQGIATHLSSSAIGIWPWHHSWHKPSDERRNLIKAGALILAEIERLDRASGITAQGAQGGEG